jgi:SAM-dependent methyltransferase
MKQLVGKLNSNGDARRYPVDSIFASSFEPRATPIYISTQAILAGQHGLCFKPGFSYLDIGCADGWNIAFLAATYPMAKFVGIDINPRAVACAQALFGTLKLSNAEALVGDITQLSTLFAPSSFDYAVCCGAYSWLDEPARQAFWPQVNHILKERGHLAISYASSPGADPIHALHTALREQSPDRDVSTEQALKAAIVSLRASPQKLSVLLASESAQQRWLALQNSNLAQEAHEVLAPHAQTFTAFQIATVAHSSGFVGLDEFTDKSQISSSDNTDAARRFDLFMKEGEKNKSFDGELSPVCLIKKATITQSPMIVTPMEVALEQFGQLKVRRMVASGDYIFTTGALRGPTGAPTALSSYNQNALLLPLEHSFSGVLASPVLGSAIILPPTDRVLLASALGLDLTQLRQEIGAAAQKSGRAPAALQSTTAFKDWISQRSKAFSQQAIPMLESLGILTTETTSKGLNQNWSNAIINSTPHHQEAAATT